MRNFKSAAGKVYRQVDCNDGFVVHDVKKYEDVELSHDDILVE